MAQDNKKIYTITINGVKESIESIEALKSKLDALDEKIEALHGVSIGNPMKGASSDMDDVAKKTEAVADGQSKVNQELIKTKDIINGIAKDKEKLLRLMQVIQRHLQRWFHWVVLTVPRQRELLHMSKGRDSWLR